ncbi:MAG: prephenate dehydrogenase [Anaerolineae bacterium]|nr:prephenate dehydrogenase [Anaerolineae bacterium]
MARVNVTIIGLQRLGTSFGLALKRLMKTPGNQHEFIIAGNDEDSGAMKAARQMGAIDQDVRALESAVEKADLVLMASPYDVTKEIFSVIGPVLKPGAVVMDTSPLKLPAIDWAKRVFRRNAEGQYEAYLVGVTPVINPAYLNDSSNDTSTARADLFDKGLLVVSPSPDCPQEAVQLIAELADLMELKVHFADPAEHDGIIAGMEALPLLLQLGYFRNLNGSKAWDDLQRFGNPAFALATYQLGQSTPEDLSALIHRNRENTVRALESLIGTLDELRDVLASGDDITVTEVFTDSIERYERWLKARRSSKWGDQPETPSVQGGGLMGSLGSMLMPFGGKKRAKDDGKK